MDTKFLIRFATIWIVNSVLLFFASWLYPSDFVLGNANLDKNMAVVLSGFLLTLFCRLSKIVLKKVDLRFKERYKMFVTYWLINSVGIWVIARLEAFSGLGISAYYWAFGLGFITSFFQWLVRQGFKQAKLLQK